MNEKKKRPAWEYVFIAILLLVILKMFGSRDSSISNYTIERAGEHESTDDSGEIGVSETESELRKVVSEIVLFSDLKTDGDVIAIDFTSHPDSDAGVTKSKTRKTIARLLEAFQKTRVPYNKVRITVYHQLVDVYGDEDVGKVVLVAYSKDAIDKINFSGFSSDDVYRISDDHWINPVFKD